ncbi:hypothetical protein GY45DRAFT_1322340 [Cubamyces sp. BRFM 1775]|nr:hypothetical protein GY45DRAFT_1322340 [Cubamyces sp. BRFM 1775]
MAIFGRVGTVCAVSRGVLRCRRDCIGGPIAPILATRRASGPVSRIGRRSAGVQNHTLLLQTAAAADNPSASEQRICHPTNQPAGQPASALHSSSSARTLVRRAAHSLPSRGQSGLAGLVGDPRVAARQLAARAPFSLSSPKTRPR